MSDYIIRMQGIVKDFPGTRALNQVNLEIKRGEVHALLGENGAGKSTLMNILLGVLKRDEGTIEYDGKALQVRTPTEALRLGISMVPQELNLVPEASVAENIFLGDIKRDNRKPINWKQVNERAGQVMDELGLKLDVTRQVKDLSASFQQMVLIARSFAYDPKVLILDEPTAALTNEEAKLVFEMMRRLREKGTAIIFITHHLNEVMAIADRITILRDGNLVHVCNIEDITKDEIVSYMANRKVERRKHVARKVSDDVIMEVKNFSRGKEYRNISFQVHRGEILCFAGLIGAGRTELFNTIFGLNRPDSHDAEICFEGKKVQIKGPRDAIRLGIGYLPEERRQMGIFPILNITENMMMPSYRQYSSHGILRFGELAKVAGSYVDKIRVKTPSLETHIENLSGGNQQKVIVARWIAQGAKLIIFDEPTRGIDVNAKDEIHNVITDLADNGVTVIVISSEMEEVLGLADRIIIMHEGIKKGEVMNSDLLKEEEVLSYSFKDD